MLVEDDSKDLESISNDDTIKPSSEEDNDDIPSLSERCIVILLSL